MQTPYQVDKRLVRKAFDQAAPSYDENAVLQKEVALRLLERLELIKQKPGRIIDIGTGTGAWSAELGKRYKGSHILALDLAPAMLKVARSRLSLWSRRFGNHSFVCGDAERLPLQDRSVDMIFSNLAIQWCQDLDAAFAEFKRILKPGGVLMFTTFGPDTLTELRQSWARTDDAVHVNAFMDMHDVGDALMRAGLGNPVMDTERLTLTYRDPTKLMRELKAIGAHNVTAGRPHGLTGKNRLRRMLEAYEQFRTGDGLLPATYEIIYGHAWGTDLIRRSPGLSDEITIPLTQIGKK